MTSGPLEACVPIFRASKIFKNIEILSFNGYRWFLWSYMYKEKLKELSYLLMFHENKLVLT